MPYSKVYVNTGDPITEENLMEFRLLYEGELMPSGGSNSRAPHKHTIRRYFHPQLRRLWAAKQNLRELACHWSIHALNSNPAPVLETEDEQIAAGLTFLGNKWNRAGYQLIPLVTEGLALRCSLDILLLRPNDKQFVFNQGDLDGQVKTLFDALRIPANMDEAGGLAPQQDETPFFCLLEDDRLVSEVRVTSDELLLLPGQRELKANDCFAVIHVRLNHNGHGLHHYFRLRRRALRAVSCTAEGREDETTVPNSQQW